MNFKLFALVIFFLIAAGKCQGKNILVLLGVGSETVDKWNKALLKGLANRQHDLTIISATTWPNDEEDSLINAEFIHLETTQAVLRTRYANVSNEELLQQSTWKYIIHWYDRQMSTCRANLESVGFSGALHLAVKEKRKFDLIIYDLAYGRGCLLHLAYLFTNAPIVGISSGHLNDEIWNEQGVLSPAFDAYMLSDFGMNLNYWQRLQNTALYAFDYLYRQWLVKPIIDGIWTHNMHAKNLITPKGLDSLEPRFKAILANYHPALHTIQTLPVSVIPVPALHLQEISEPLAKIVLDFIENTELQVILIDIKMSVLATEIIQDFLNIFRTMPDNAFIWLNGDEKLIGKSKPKNLLLLSNEDSDKILAHDKVKCSVITPEISNIQESIYHGVTPLTIVSRPEHRYLAQRLKERHLGLSIESNKIDSSLLHSNLLRCLKEKSLQNNVKQFQASLRKRQIPALDTAIWWLEHLLELPESNEYLLKPSRKPLSFFAQQSLDVIIILQIFIILALINTYIVIRRTIHNFKEYGLKSKKKKEVQKKSDEKNKKTKKTKTKTS